MNKLTCPTHSRILIGKKECQDCSNTTKDKKCKYDTKAKSFCMTHRKFCSQQDKKCYCVCHSPFSSCPICEHCRPAVEIALKVQQDKQEIQESISEKLVKAEVKALNESQNKIKEMHGEYKLSQQDKPASQRGEQEWWEDRFDKEFSHQYGCCGACLGNSKEVKLFISNLLTQERERWIEAVIDKTRASYIEVCKAEKYDCVEADGFTKAMFFIQDYLDSLKGTP